MIAQIGMLNNVELGSASPEMRMRLKPTRPRVAEEMKSECDAAIQSTLADGRRDQVKEWCARSAFGLIVKYSNLPPTSGSTDSPYRHIASLLYEIVDPNSRRIDFERTSEAVLRRFAPLIGTNHNRKTF